MVGQAEIIFFYDDSYGYFSLVDDTQSASVKLADRTKSAAGNRRFESPDGRLVAELSITMSDVSRGRALGPGLEGELRLTLSGEPIFYPHPFSRSVIYGPIDCDSDQ